jgi:hypothetical protein
VVRAEFGGSVPVFSHEPPNSAAAHAPQIQERSHMWTCQKSYGTTHPVQIG